ncbi:laccase domain-containing protein [Actinomyces viscosus]|uniref:Laccase domain protein yfiH n=1 Tax=Actinomyces viscosus TaxID=1656 RepID=A0A448PJU3_ACTVI|nr:polyphenol oxidase family protein [Actinomyces viscosus]TFH54101.1 laccase domain-containing protein [Actinomyces viscosus]VEI15275.1 Laccase domain protein yfiH [Actinomyces viscosus]
MCDTNIGRVDDLIEVDLGPGARGYFTTRGLRARPVPDRSGPGAQVEERGSGIDGDGAGDGRASAYSGWNLALHVGDDPQRVDSHRRRLEALLGLEQDRHLAWMNQVHSAVVAEARAESVPTADALVLNARATGAPAGCCVLVADCVPLLLASRDGFLTAAVHAGRRGMLDGVVPATIESLRRAGAEPAELWAVVGPSVCGACYEVPDHMRALSAQREPACASRTSWGTPGLDVAAGVLAQLERAGVGHISAGQWCTYEDPRFYSFRRDGVTGRQAGVVVPR